MYQNMLTVDYDYFNILYCGYSTYDDLFCVTLFTFGVNMMILRQFYLVSWTDNVIFGWIKVNVSKCHPVQIPKVVWGAICKQYVSKYVIRMIHVATHSRGSGYNELEDSEQTRGRQLYHLCGNISFIGNLYQNLSIQKDIVISQVNKCTNLTVTLLIPNICFIF